MLSKKVRTASFIVSFLLFFSGLAYLLYLQILFPRLVPHHGAGEKFALNPVNNYTFHIPWSAYSRLHLTLEANDTVRLYVNGDYVCDCTHYSFVIEPGDGTSILLMSNSSVSGMFEAWQETPLGRQLLALTLLLTGLIGVVISIRTELKRSHARGDDVKV